MHHCNNPACVKHIVCKYIRKNGKVIRPKRASAFSFCTEAESKKKKVVREK